MTPLETETEQDQAHSRISPKIANMTLSTDLSKLSAGKKCVPETYLDHLLEQNLQFIRVTYECVLLILQLVHGGGDFYLASI